MWVVSHFGSWESSPMVTWWPLRVTASTGSVLIGTLGAPLCWLLTGWDAPCRAEVGSQGWLAWCTGFRIQPRNVVMDAPVFACYVCLRKLIVCALQLYVLFNHGYKINDLRQLMYHNPQFTLMKALCNVCALHCINVSWTRQLWHYCLRKLCMYVQWVLFKRQPILHRNPQFPGYASFMWCYLYVQYIVMYIIHCCQINCINYLMCYVFFLSTRPHHTLFYS